MNSGAANPHRGSSFESFLEEEGILEQVTMAANGRANVADKPKHDELVSQLTSPGWRLIPTGIDPAVEGTLEDMARAAHARRKSGQHPGVVQRAEDSLELEAFDLEQLWWHMGLPM